MGVPGLYKWLSRKCPRCIVPVNENSDALSGNFGDVDALYLDVNGIIHSCVVDPSEDDIFLRIFEYINNLFSIIQPRRLLFLAIDGVAPRAKLNQQRSRRFRKVKTDEEELNLRRQIHAELAQRGFEVVSGNEDEREGFDRNMITPGTSFMFRLMKALRQFVVKKLQNSWKGISVVLSDSSVPGEGEHKIMDFIRNMSKHSIVDMNDFRSIVYGSDADLIFLCLALHKPHMGILREKYMPPYCKARMRPQMELFSLDILRDYFELEFRNLTSLSFYNLDRIIDDFIFLCMFIGNDFLPRIPSMDVREDIITKLIAMYKKELPVIGSYMTNCGEMDPVSVRHFLSFFGVIETELLEGIKLEKQKRFNTQRRRSMRHAERESPKSGGSSKVITKNDFDDLLQKELHERNYIEFIAPDTVKFGMRGWKHRYYRMKCGIEFNPANRDSVFDICRSYVLGISWTLSLYYKGVPSWNLYYPYHYAPFATELCADERLWNDISFDLGKPLTPFQQLMSVQPLKSARSCLPAQYYEMMSNFDSPLSKYFPTEFTVDLEGKIFSWEGIVILPFVDENKLAEVTADLDRELEGEVKERNKAGNASLFANSSTMTNSQELLSFGGTLEEKECHNDVLEFLYFFSC